MNEAPKTPPKKITALELAEFCEKIAYDRKAENIVRLDMTDIEGAQSDFYLICTGLSTPHIGAIAERIQREVRTAMSIRPIAVDGTPQSGWIILDFSYIMIHLLTVETRDKYQLEDLWSDARKTDVVARLDAARKQSAAGK